MSYPPPSIPEWPAVPPDEATPPYRVPQPGDTIRNQSGAWGIVNGVGTLRVGDGWEIGYFVYAGDGGLTFWCEDSVRVLVRNTARAEQSNG